MFKINYHESSLSLKKLKLLILVARKNIIYKNIANTDKS